MDESLVRRGIKTLRKQGVLSLIKKIRHYLAVRKYNLAIDKIYNSPILQSPTITVLDIGARDGFQSNLSRVHANNKLHVVGIEPDSKECNRLQSAYPMYDWYDIGLSDTSGEKKLYLPKGRGKSSMYKTNSEFFDRFDIWDDEWETEKIESVEVTTLDEFTKSKEWRFDIAKIDTEGSEGDIIVGGKQTLQDVYILELEANFKQRFIDCMTFCEINEHLEEIGFEILDLQFLPWGMTRRIRRDGIDPNPLDGELVWSNAFYINRQESYINNSLKQIIIALIYRKKTLALQILDSADELSDEEKQELQDILSSIPN